MTRKTDDKQSAKTEVKTKIDLKSVEEYQKILIADPNSKVFAVLADAYNDMGIIEQAENLARRGVSRHPNYAPGYVTWAKICIKKNLMEKALELLQKAIELSPDNLLAHQTIGEVYLQLKRPKDALKAHKIALFLNPQNERSKLVVKKLESLSADEFEEDSFQMAPVQKIQDASKNSKKPESKQELTRNLETSLSLIDALIVRREPIQAKQKLEELIQKYPGNPQIEERLKILDHEAEFEKPENLSPLPYREKKALDLKIRKLNQVLQTINEYRTKLNPEIG